ncbi:MFS transporter [Halopseudomonas maritima]|uniref:MFS transporter n=1 Tax=Halopseudomonas maritima TaxID=2918528 RepID=UPI001EECBF79|nr:MFS transporter [Halopseudomonas maritima]UJJ32840.1 MFS transporter [Halopseudomonas maritima]
MFDPKPHWRTLRSVWRMLSLTVLLLPILLVVVLGDWNGLFDAAAVPLFAIGMTTLLLTLWRFRLYKRALIRVDALGTSDEAAGAWASLHRLQSLGLSAAALPALVALVHYFCVGEVIPLVLLVVVSLGVMLLYRPPAAWVD